MKLDFVNMARIGFVYAARGLISPNVRYAAFGVIDAQHFEAFFVLKEDRELDRAAIRQICEAFEAQHPDAVTAAEGRLRIDCRIEVRPDPLSFPPEGGLTPFFIEFDGRHLLDEPEQDPPAWWVEAHATRPR